MSGKSDRLRAIYDRIQRAARYHCPTEAEDFAQDAIQVVLELPLSYWNLDETGQPAYTDAYLAQRGCLIARRARYREHRRKVQIFTASDLVAGNDDDFFATIPDPDFDEETMLDSFQAAGNLARAVSSLPLPAQYVLTAVQQLMVESTVPDNKALANTICTHCGGYAASEAACRHCKLVTTSLKKHNGIVTSLVQVKGNLHRCQTCGRFAGNTAHICPLTSTPQALVGVLGRRIGGDAEKLYGIVRVEQLFAEAAQNENKSIKLFHVHTQALLEATLDAVPALVRSGYLPEAWRGGTMYRVLGKDNQVYQVFNLDDKLSFAPLAHGPLHQTTNSTSFWPRGTVKLADLSNRLGMKRTALDEHMKVLRTGLSPMRN